MPTWLDAVGIFLGSQWSPFVAGLLGGGSLVALALRRVVGDNYQERRENKAATADACIRCVDAIIRLEREVLEWESDVADGCVSRTPWPEDYVANARLELAKSRRLTGDAFFAAAAKYLGCWADLAKVLEFGEPWWEFNPNPGPDVLWRQMLKSIPPNVRAKVAPGHMLNLAEARAQKRREIALSAKKKAQALWAETDAASELKKLQ
ncbi:hypothetical protein [Corallococcus carmarthensis]|uniref:hypothetical protein n=1 Tax=Corallococcus carmarthensis TaxID=2316728 RepID=UPI0011C350E4|nr:hypothetical protein [Corallococcus carmarthensis]